MKKYMFILVLSIGLLSFTTARLTCTACPESIVITHRGQQKITEDKIAGEGIVQKLGDKYSHTDMRVSNIRLTANSYLHWHSLPGGQLMIVTEGKGYYQSKGKEVIKIQKGDVIETTPGLYYWQGAAPDADLEFISISTQKSDSLINWHEQVSDKEYQAAIDVAGNSRDI
ncbi:hypothetical protein ACR79T_07585 [Sphingobacterium spiritivorum]|uniref:hypothetical protein n=1 Tax=Sphingobacterium spiritivorum TaxID=258 RepID=UPI003DA45586